MARREGDINNAVTEREGWRARASASGGIHMHITDLRSAQGVNYIVQGRRAGHKMLMEIRQDMASQYDLTSA